MKKTNLTGMAVALGMASVAVAAFAAAAPAHAAGDIKAHDLVGPCTGCHSIPGYQASFPQVYRVPKIGGQSEKYLESALQAYKKGERNHPTMSAIARDLTDEQITLVAGYFASRTAE